MCEHCGSDAIPIGLSPYNFEPLFMQCVGCENRWHIQQRHEYLWHVADPFVLRGKERLRS